MAGSSKRAKNDSRISRRRFVGRAGIAAGALGGVASARGQNSQVPANREMRTDVVVVGAGMGGLTTAVRAQREGADVVLLEKSSERGGTMSHSEGAVWTYESFEDLRNDAPHGDPELQRTVFDTLLQVYEFYDSIGAPLGAADEGERRTRRIAPVAFTNFMVGQLESAGGTLLMETPMLRLLTNRQHEIIGVLAEGPDGPIRIQAKAVVLATGGFAGNAQLVTQNITRQFGSLYQRNVAFDGLMPPLTGDGFLAASQIGAAPSLGGFDAFYGHVLPARPAKFSHPLSDYSIYHGAWTVAVNLYGRRFADESQGRVAGRQIARVGDHFISQEIARQPEATAAYIWDGPINEEHALAENNLGSLDKFDAFRQAGAPVATANTLEELARQMEGWGRGVPAGQVLGTLSEYNQAARNATAGKLPVPKASSRNALPIQQPPFYAILGTTGITATHGGLRVNSRGQVLSTTGRPLPGLFASGIDVGNFCNYAYLGALCLGAVFGYLSGANAARQPEPRGGWE